MAAPLSTISIYDTGLKNLLFSKFGTYLGRTSVEDCVIFQPREVAQREYAEKKGNTLVNFVSFWRSAPVFSWDRQRTPTAHRGINLSYSNTDETGAINAKAVPSDVNYEITFWTSKLDSMQELSEEFLFWIHESPDLELTVNGYPFNGNLHFGEGSDYSPIQIYQVGRYFVYTYSLKLDAWLIRFEELKTIKTIFLKGYTGDKTSNIEIFSYTIT